VKRWSERNEWAKEEIKEIGQRDGVKEMEQK
jgi:hypothetical protein